MLYHESAFVEWWIAMWSSWATEFGAADKTLWELLSLTEKLLFHLAQFLCQYRTRPGDVCNCSMTTAFKWLFVTIHEATWSHTSNGRYHVPETAFTVRESNIQKWEREKWECVSEDVQEIAKRNDIRHFSPTATWPWPPQNCLWPAEQFSHSSAVNQPALMRMASAYAHTSWTCIQPVHARCW